ncbi:MAG TPA: lactonase family protein [Bacteroidia bacterium]|nr:lactonase family protein [Bacteroidia bacterium]
MRAKHLIAVIFCFTLSLTKAQNNSKTYLFIGTYTGGKPDKGIYVYEFDSNLGKLKFVSNAENITNPSFITIAPNGKFLYACTDTKIPNAGSITSFKIDSVNGKLSLLNKQPSGGENPVYVTVHKNNKYVVNGNYTEGTASVYTTNVDGSLNPYSQVLQFEGSSIKPNQDKAHIHSTVFSPAYNYLFMPDLGADKIRVFKFDTTKPQPLVIKDSLVINTVLGAGPRHFTFHPNGKFAYCIEEMSGTVSVYTYNNGKLDSIQRIFSYAKIQNAYGSADIHISPDGLFLYASNRGGEENTISIFSINKENGRLKLAGHQPTLGEHPRNFTIDPTGKYLLVANATTSNIVVFKRDLKTGLLTFTGIEIKVPSPSCLQMRKYILQAK